MRLTYLLIMMLFIDLASAITINEIMYNPSGSDNNLEFIELYADNMPDLTDHIIADEDASDLLEPMQILPSNYALIVEEGFDYIGINASIYSTGATIGDNLDNTGDILTLYSLNQEVLATTFYNDTYANGNGFSLELINNTFIESKEMGGTPGRENTAKAEETVIETIEDCSFTLETDKDFLNSGEKLSYSFKTNQDNFTITYWIEDIHGNMIKDLTETANTNKKSYTPKINTPEKTLIIKATMETDLCDEEAEASVVVKGNKLSKESSIEIEEIHLGNDEMVSFGETFQVDLTLYKGDTTKRVIRVWLAKDSKTISEVTKLTMYERFSTSDISIPITLKQNSKYEDEYYSLIVDGLGLRKEEKILVKGNKPKSSSSTKKKEEKTTPKIEYSLIDFKKNVSNPFNITVKIKNNDKQNDFEITSYVYKGSKSYSRARDENKQEISLAPGEEREIILRNEVLQIPTNANLKVKIRKNSQKTTSDLTEDLAFIKSSIKSSPPLKSSPKQTVKQSPSKTNESEQPELVYDGSSWTSKIPYMLLSVFVLMMVAVILKKL